MFAIVLSLNGPDEALVVPKDEVCPQVLPLPFVWVVIPKPDLIDCLEPAEHFCRAYIEAEV